MGCATQRTQSGSFAAAVIPVTLFLSGAVTAQTGSADANATDVPQPGGTPPSAMQVPTSDSHPSGGWYDRDKSARFSAMYAKNWGGLSPDFGDGLLGDAGGVRSALADVGIAGTIFLTGTWWQNLLNAPRQTNGSQSYIGQRLTHLQNYGLVGTYDLGHIGLEGAQLVLDTACAASSYLGVYSRGCRILDLSFYQSFFKGRVELSAGFLPNDVEFVDTYVGGNLDTGSFGPSAILPVQSGLARQPGTAPGLNVTYHFDGNWYDKIGVQRSLYPQGQGLVTDYSVLNHSGVRFDEPLSRTLLIDQVGYKRPASADGLSSDFRLGGLYNWSDYSNFDTGSVSHNHNIFVLGDQQLNQPDPQVPFRGWYAGFTFMDSPSEVNVFRRYYEARFYADAPFRTRLGDQFSIVFTHSLFSKDARRALIAGGAFPPPTDATSVTLSYALKVAHGIYLDPGLTYTNHPSFVTTPNEGHDLNLLVAVTVYL